MLRIDDSLVVLGCLLLVAGRSKETLVGLHAVVAPLFFRGGDECASKEFAMFCVAGGAASLCWRGRAMFIGSRRLSREFDPTKGYAGQDILSCSSLFPKTEQHFKALH